MCLCRCWLGVASLCSLLHLVPGALHAGSDRPQPQQESELARFCVGILDDRATHHHGQMFQARTVHADDREPVGFIRGMRAGIQGGERDVAPVSAAYMDNHLPGAAPVAQPDPEAALFKLIRRNCRAVENEELQRLLDQVRATTVAFGIPNPNHCTCHLALSCHLAVLSLKEVGMPAPAGL